MRRADIDPGAWVISTDAVSELITAKTKLMVIVHLYGMPADMDTILAGAGNFGIPVVEDCAQAPSAQYKGKRFEASPCGPTDLVDAKLVFRWESRQIMEASYEQFSGSNGWAVAAELLYGRAKLCYQATAGTTA